MPVFISHRTADNVIAKKVYDRLTYRHGITCYLDDLDKEADHCSRITALIVTRLTSCTNLLALVTRNTQGSWWVPFEVGVARQAPRIITSYTDLSHGVLPDFLTEWPVLRGDSAVDTFGRTLQETSFGPKTQLSGAPGVGLGRCGKRFKVPSRVEDCATAITRFNS